MFKTIPLAIVIMLAGVSTGFAQDNQEQGRRQGPPQEAFTACDNLTEGDGCSFNTPHGDLTGQCVQDRRGDGLICRPENRGRMGNRQGRQGPPQEALDACTGRNVGDTCSFETPRGELTGECVNPPRSQDLICLPENHRRRQDR